MTKATGDRVDCTKLVSGSVREQRLELGLAAQTITLPQMDRRRMGRWPPNRRTIGMTDSRRWSAPMGPPVGPTGCVETAAACYACIGGRGISRGSRSGHGAIPPDGVAAFVVLRETRRAARIFCKHYRDLGVAHFYCRQLQRRCSADLAAAQPPDVTLGKRRSYRESQFGLDWLNWLYLCGRAGRWCTDRHADELLVYDQMDAHSCPPLRGGS